MASAPPTSQLHAHEEPQHEQQQADDQAPFDLLSLISRAGTTQASIWRHLDARSKLAMWCACTATRDMVQACAHELTLRLGKGGSEAQQAQLLAPGLTRRVSVLGRLVCLKHSIKVSGGRQFLHLSYGQG